MKANVKYVGISVVVIVALYLTYDLSKPYLYPCESIFQQTSTQIGGNLETVKASGGLFIGQKKIQELTERSQMLALNLKTCCTLSDKQILTSKEFLSCKGSADQYKKKLETLVARINEAQEAKAQGNTEVVNQKVSEINSIIESSEKDVREISNSVDPISENSMADGTTSGSEETRSVSGNETEPNNTILEAQEVSAGQTIEGEISSGEDTDYYWFTYDGDLRDKVDISLENLSTTLEPELNFYNQNKSRFYDTYDGTRGANLNAWIIVEPNTEYYVQVSRFSGNGGAYKLVISDPLNVYDEHEMNDDPFNATAINLGETVIANLLDANDQDWYRIDNVPGEKVQISFENGSTKLKPEVYVYNEQKTEIANRYNSTGGGNLVFDVSVKPNSTVYVSTGVWSRAPILSDYRITIQ